MLIMPGKYILPIVEIFAPVSQAIKPAQDV